MAKVKIPDFEAVLENARVRMNVAGTEPDSSFDVYDDARKIRIATELQVERNRRLTYVARDELINADVDYERQLAVMYKEKRPVALGMSRTVEMARLSIQGWVLAEDVALKQPVVLGDNFPHQLKGLLLSQYAEVMHYTYPLGWKYPSRYGFDIWGNYESDMYDGEATEPLAAETEKLSLDIAGRFRPNDLEAKIRSVSGVFSLEDLLANLVVKHNLNPEPFVVAANSVS